MIKLEEFSKLRKSDHLVVLDTNILLELYRQPANISLDVINALKQIRENIYVPRQVYEEYLRNYQALCGGEKKKYHKVKRELSESVKKLQDEIDNKISEYRKHNYTDITKLKKDLSQKIEELQDIIKNFEYDHKTEIQLDIDFLKDDKVKDFVDLLMAEERIGEDILFSQKLLILKEGKVRFDNLIPPGYMDRDKAGIDKYGDLFVWKSILAIAKKRNVNIIFVCNDVKEDWWNKDNDVLINLRDELLGEFKEINPFLNIEFLTLEKFFSYITEELHIGKSKSALQLSALDDSKVFLNKYNDDIEKKIGEILTTINVEEELEEDFIDIGEEQIYWNISDVSVDREEKNILYYISLDISALADIKHQEPEERPYSAGKLAISLEGRIKLQIEEYATDSKLLKLEVKKNDVYHIEPEEWQKIKVDKEDKSCKELIRECKEIKKYKGTIEKNKLEWETIDNASGAVRMQEYAKIMRDASKFVISPKEIEAARQEARFLELYYRYME